MAFPIQLTLGTSNKVSVNYQSQEVSINVTYQLEHGENDLLAVVSEKTSEVVAAHALAWSRVRGEASCEKKTQILPIVKTMAVPEIEEISAPLSPLLSGAQQNAIEALLAQAGWSLSDIEAHLLTEFGKSEICELSASQASQWLLELQRVARQTTQARSQERRAATGHQNGHRK